MITIYDLYNVRHTSCCVTFREEPKDKFCGVCATNEYGYVYGASVLVQDNDESSLFTNPEDAVSVIADVFIL